jgi:Xaa-Pro aminopeptidase
MNGEDTRPVPGSETATRLGFEAVEPTSKLLGDVFAAIGDPFRENQAGQAVVYVLSPNPKVLDMRADPRFVRFLKQGAPNTTFRDLAPILGEMRKAKTPAEIALLQKAIDITGEADAEVMKIIRPELFEYQLEAKVLDAFTNGGALRVGFASIIGSGPNSTIPHYFANSRRMKDGDLVVVDIGGEYDLYTADITRTFPVNGKFTPRQREIYQLVLDAQSEAEKHMEPDKTRLFEMTGFVSDYLRKSPLRAKDTDGQEHTMDHFFIHGLGHYLGLDVHDVGDGTKPMKPGEVFTIEPGLYIKSENIGIRIEDDYLMTETGPVKLSKNIPSDPDEIEKVIARGKKD